MGSCFRSAQSVLTGLPSSRLQENHHLAATFTLLLNPDYDFLSSLSQAEMSALRKVRKTSEQSFFLFGLRLRAETTRCGRCAPWVKTPGAVWLSARPGEFGSRATVGLAPQGKVHTPCWPHAPSTLGLRGALKVTDCDLRALLDVRQGEEREGVGVQGFLKWRWSRLPSRVH